MMKDLVSIVISTYNYGKYVTRAVESALSQSYTNIEVIVIDDGSSDETAEVLKPYFGKISYLYQKNQGSAVALNNGVKLAKGNYIAFMDADDLHEPDKTEVQVGLFKANAEAGLIFGWSKFIDENGKLMDIKTSRCLKEQLSLLDIIRGNETLFFSSVMIKKECLDIIGPFDPRSQCARDFEMYIKVTESKYKIICAQKVLGSYRLHSNFSNNPELFSHQIKGVLDRFFAQSGQSSDVLKVKSEAYFNHLYYEFCWQYLYKGDIGKFREYLFEAIRLRPEILEKVETFKAWAANFVPLKLRTKLNILNALDDSVMCILETLKEFFKEKQLSAVKHQEINAYVNAYQGIAELYYDAGKYQLSKENLLNIVKVNPIYMFRRRFIMQVIKSVCGANTVKTIKQFLKR